MSERPLCEACGQPRPRTPEERRQQALKATRTRWERHREALAAGALTTSKAAVQPTSTVMPIVKLPEGPIVLGSTPIPLRASRAACFKCAHKHPPNNDCGCACHQEA